MMNNGPNRLYLWDDPETKLRYLDVALKGTSWTADILIPKDKPELDSRKITKDLQARGFVVSEDKDAFGSPILHVKSLGDHTSLITNLSELGLVKGTQKSLDNVSSALTQTLKRAGEYAHYTVSDSARLIGAVYLVGDMVVTAAPAFNRSATSTSAHSKTGVIEGLKDPYNVLQYGQGISTILHSMIYMLFAHDGKDTLLKEMNQHMQAQQSPAAPDQPIDISRWAAEPVHRNIFQQGSDYLGKHALKVGALLLIGGQVGFIGGGFMRMNRWAAQMKALEQGTLGAEALESIASLATKEGQTIAEIAKNNYDAGLFEVGRGAMSVATWGTFIRDPKQHDEKSSWFSNPIVRAVQEFDEHPQRAASIMSIASSSMGMLAGRKKGNLMQQCGEAVYFIADGLMFVTKKKNYGQENANQDEIKIEAASHFIAHAPFAVAPSRHAEFAGQLADYLIAQEQQENGKAPENTERRAHIVEGVCDGLSQADTPYNRIITALANLVSRLPEDSRAEVTNTLAESLVQDPNLFADTQDIIRDVASKTRSPRLPYRFMNEAISDMVTLVYTVPGMRSPDRAIAIFEACEKAFSPTIREKGEMRDQLVQEMEKQAMAALKPKPEIPDNKVANAALVSRLHSAAAHSHSAQL